MANEKTRDDPDREERRTRIRAWLANLPAEVAQVYEDQKREE